LYSAALYLSLVIISTDYLICFLTEGTETWQGDRKKAAVTLERQRQARHPSEAILDEFSKVFSSSQMQMDLNLEFNEVIGGEAQSINPKAGTALHPIISPLVSVRFEIWRRCGDIGTLHSCR
jgi:hypothetical protein